MPDPDDELIPLRPKRPEPEPAPVSPALAQQEVETAAGKHRYALDNWRRFSLSLFAGGVIAGVAAAIPFTRWTVTVLLIIIHELGHAATCWAFGYPSIPALDLQHGGGLAPSWDRVPAIAWAVPILLFGSGFAAAQNRLTRVCVGIVLLLFVGLALTEWHQALIVAMGHGLVAIFAALFILRGLTGLHVKLGVERPLYVAIGLIFIGLEIQTSWMLLDNLVYREHYLHAKQGIVRDDLSRLADDYFHTSFETMAGAVLVSNVLALLAGLALSALLTHHTARAAT